EPSGAFTGEVSADMLKSTGVDFVILGHSERRQYFGEDEILLAQKVEAVLNHDMSVIFCVGEPLDIREADEHKQYIKQQISKSLFHLTPEQFQFVTIAYE